MSDFQTVCAYAVGPKGTGKTRGLWDLFISKFPRRVSIDFTGEMKEKYNPQAIDCYSIDELRDALRACSKRTMWHVTLSMRKDELQRRARFTDADDPKAREANERRRRAMPAFQLSAMLNPPRTSAEHRSFSREMGGVAIDCSEAAHLFPNGRTHPDLLEFIQGGRHNKLHLFMASQAPAAVSPELRSAADYFLAFRTQEHTIWEFWAKVASPAIADVIAELPDYYCAYFVKREQRVYILDEKRQVTRVLDYRGNEV